jgi:DNA mismatch endonuclease (patch repair protein)
MAAIHSKNTKPEVILRKALWARGLRFRIHYGNEKIDIAFPNKKVAIFVDGCFWHGCPIHSHLPKSNQEYWYPKLKKNIERDKLKNKHLEKEGWLVMHFWEHEINESLKNIEKIKSALEKRAVS